ncbi:MAG: hypothetical protein ACK56I_16710, partial [bacterium]
MYHAGRRMPPDGEGRQKQHLHALAERRVDARVHGHHGMLAVVAGHQAQVVGGPVRADLRRHRIAQVEHREGSAHEPEQPPQTRLERDEPFGRQHEGAQPPRRQPQGQGQCEEHSAVVAMCQSEAEQDHRVSGRAEQKRKGNLLLPRQTHRQPAPQNAPQSVASA